jgi:hypothetical protein
MFQLTYTQQHLEEVDEMAYSIMRTQDVQKVVNILIPDEPPQDKFEYIYAEKVFTSRIVAAQPNIQDPNALPSIAYEVVNPLFPPLVLLGHHARAAILCIALKEYRDGLGFVASMQETACQFHDDDILLCSTKLGFAIMAFLVQQKDIANILYESSNLAQIPLTKQGEPCISNLSPSAIKLCRCFYEIIINFAVMNDGNKNQHMTDVKRVHLLLLIKQYADEIDKTTKNRFRMKEWITETVRKFSS